MESHTNLVVRIMSRNFGVNGVVRNCLPRQPITFIAIEYLLKKLPKNSVPQIFKLSKEKNSFALPVKPACGELHFGNQ